MRPFYIKRGDDGPPVEAILRDGNRDPINLTGTEVRFICANGVDAVAEIVEATEGRVRYNWSAGQTGEAGTFDAEFRVTFGTGKRQTVPSYDHIKVIIKPDLSG